MKWVRLLYPDVVFGAVAVVGVAIIFVILVRHCDHIDANLDKMAMQAKQREAYATKLRKEKVGMEQQWRELWGLATGEESGDAKIEISDDPNQVTLVWPDGTLSGLYWQNGEWRFAEQLDTAPCDVAARDTL